MNSNLWISLRFVPDANVVGSGWRCWAGKPGRSRLGCATRGPAGCREIQFSPLHLIANNSRVAVLEAGQVPNLASRALGLSLRRMSRDIGAAHGYPVLLAETSVHPSRFAGTCYAVRGKLQPAQTDVLDLPRVNGSHQNAHNSPL